MCFLSGGKSVYWDNPYIRLNCFYTQEILKELMILPPPLHLLCRNCKKKIIERSWRVEVLKSILQSVILCPWCVRRLFGCSRSKAGEVRISPELLSRRCCGKCSSAKLGVLSVAFICNKNHLRFYIFSNYNWNWINKSKWFHNWFFFIPDTSTKSFLSWKFKKFWESLQYLLVM